MMDILVVSLCAHVHHTFKSKDVLRTFIWLYINRQMWGKISSSRERGGVDGARNIWKFKLMLAYVSNLYYIYFSYIFHHESDNVAAVLFLDQALKYKKLPKVFFLHNRTNVMNSIKFNFINHDLDFQECKCSISQSATSSGFFWMCVIVVVVQQHSGHACGHGEYSLSRKQK